MGYTKKKNNYVAMRTKIMGLQAIAKRVETLTVKHPIMRDIEVSTF